MVNPSNRVGYSAAELAWVQANAARRRADMHRDFCAVFGRADVTATNLTRLLARNGWTPVRRMDGPTETVSKDGYISLKLKGSPCKFVLKQRYVWEREVGPIPKGYVLKCLGDRKNTDPSNWVLVPSGVATRLTNQAVKLHALPAEIQPTLIAKAFLEHAVAEKIGKTLDGQKRRIHRRKCPLPKQTP